MASPQPTPAPRPWQAPQPHAPQAARRRPSASAALPFAGPLLLFIVWDLVVRVGWVKPILLPAPADTLATLLTGLAGGALLGDFLTTVWRTVQAFVIAAVLGVPLGVLLGSQERAYRSVEFLIDFFRSTPSSALIPLFLMIFGVSDVNKIAIAAFGAWLIVVFNSAYGVINARKQRVMAARVMGASRWQIFRHITYPLLTPIIAVVMTFSVLFTFTDFQLIWAMTRGGPVNATHLMATYSYQKGILGGQLGEGAAIATAMVPFLLAAIMVSWFGLQQRKWQQGSKE